MIENRLTFLVGVIILAMTMHPVVQFLLGLGMMILGLVLMNKERGIT